MKRDLFIFLILFSISLAGWGQSSLPAVIARDTIVTASGTPCHIDQNLTVSSGVTLEIGPGVQLLLKDGVTISNNGSMILNGTEDAHIELTTASSDERWRYIYNNGSISASFTDIRRAVRFISSYGETVILNNCTVNDTYGGIGDDCIGVHNANKVIIRNCTLYGNPSAAKTDAIDVDGLSGDSISGNTISGFSDDGIDIGTNSKEMVVSHNIISNCEMAISIGETSTAKVSHNLLTNSNGGIQSHFGSVVTADRNTIYGTNQGLRAFHNGNEESSGGTINISNSIISNCLQLVYAEKPNSTLIINYCLTDSVIFPGNGNITGNPTFINPDGENFRLSGTSIAIDAGNPDNDNDGSDYTIDPDDRDPDGSRLDMGVFPYYKSNLKIIEISPSNLCISPDDSGAFSDWFRIYNQGDSSINLNGYFLSDNLQNPLKHQLVNDLHIAPGDTIIFWADNADSPGDRHLPFKLSGEGEYLSLSNPDGLLLDEKPFQRVPVNYIYKRLGLSDDWVYYSPPEFGDSGVYTGLSPDPVYSINGGLTDFPETLSLASPGLVDSVYYSMDGSNPNGGMLYNNPISILDPLTLRSVTKRSDYLPSYIHSRVFFRAGNYNLPVISLSCNEEHLYGTSGIYTNYSKSGPYWERPASVSYYGNTNFFSAITGIRIQGGNSVFMPKKSFRLHFRGGYGTSRLEGSPFNQGPSDFKNLVLRAGYDDDITRFGGTMLRDPFSTELWKMLDELATESSWSVLLLNNNYWGIYNVRESINEYFVEDHLGTNDFDLVRFQKWGKDLKYGTIDEWNKLVSYFDTSDFTRPEAYAEVSNFMDMNSLLNLLSLVHCTQFRSWTWGAFVIKPTGGKWHWTIWDTDRSYNDLNWNGFTEYANTSAEKWPNFIPQKLIQNAQFKNELINRNCDLLNTLLIPENAIAVYDSLVSILTPEMDSEFDRWNPGNRARWDVSNESVRDFLRRRPSYLYNQMKSYFSIPDTANIILHIVGNGKVKLNSLIIEDTVWHGTYMTGIPITLEAQPSPGSTFLEWEEISNLHSISVDPAGNRHITAIFDTTSQNDRKQIVLNEIMYHPEGLTSSEWVELYNPNENGVSLDGFVLTDGGLNNHFTIPVNTIIDPSGFLVIAGDLDSYNSEYATGPGVIGSFNAGINGFNLSNNGETLYLMNPDGAVEDYLQYDDQSPWPIFADGYGPSMQLISPESDNSDPASWTAIFSTPYTPGDHNITTSADQARQLEQINIRLYPNPAGRTIHLDIGGENESDIYLSIYSISGSKMAEKWIDAARGSEKISWEHGLSEPGAYILKAVFLLNGERVDKSLLLIYSGAD